MGVSATPLSRILDMHERGLLRPGASIMELGAQQLYCKGKEDFLRDFIAKMAAKNPAIKSAQQYSMQELAALANGGFMSTLMTACGLTYSAIDIFEGEGTIIFDLNRQEPPPEMLNRYDLVTNFGTTEHVVNQYLSMKTVHEITAPGGLIYHQLPLGGYYMHGYFAYTPLLFKELAEANQYEVILEGYSKGLPTKSPDFMVNNGYPDAEFFDFGIDFIFRKTADAPFRIPLETSTSLGVSEAFLAGASSMANPVVSPDQNNNLRYGSAIREDRGLVRYSGWELQRELIGRYKKKFLGFFGD
jgi:hypothetical protein